MPARPDPDIALIEELSARVRGDHASPVAHPDRELFLENLALVAEHADVAAPPPGRSPKAAFKKLVARFVRVLSVRQTAYNRAVMAVLQTLDTELRAVRAEHDRQIGTAHARLATSEATVDALASSISDSRAFLDILATDAAGLRGWVEALGAEADAWASAGGRQQLVDRLDGLQRGLDETSGWMNSLARGLDEAAGRVTLALDRLAGAEGAAVEARAGVARERARIDLLLAEVRQPDSPGPISRETAARLEVARSSLVYAQLEERFRGTSEDLVGRFERGYAAELDELAERGGPAVDVGCGTGEWLSVLARHGIPGWGVDLSPEAVERARAKGLDARVDDGLKALADVGPGSLAAVTAFQVIEHMAFDDLVALVEAALVALRPGGFVILETPNPLNLAVAASTFHLDPSHLRPIPPDLADFVLTNVGFVDVEIRFLNAGLGPRLPDLGAESTPTAAALVKRINETFFGPPDYAVIGRKLMTGRAPDDAD